MSNEEYDESTVAVEAEEEGEVRSGAPTEEEVFPPDRPVPGLDILDVVYNSVYQLAKEGRPPAYVFLRTDMYQKAKDANAVPSGDTGIAVTPGYMSWTDKELGLHCLIQPLCPGEGQKPFMVAFTHQEAVQIVRDSFPRDSFQYAASTQEASTSTTDPADVVETNNG